MSKNTTEIDTTTEAASPNEHSVMPEKASDLLLQSAEPFDKACVMVREMEDQIEALLTEKAVLAGALEELCFLKAIKDRCGKTPEYLERQPKAWDAAFQVVSTLEA